MTSSFNDQIRAAAGRAAPASAIEHEQPVGDLGVGVGGAAAPPPRKPTNAFINERIRKGAAIVRSVQLRDGLDLGDLEDPWR
jgi:hypothetical protein